MLQRVAAAPRAQLRIALGQHSEAGRKETNQDFHGACIPEEPLLTAKGIAIAIADGVSSSPVSRVAAEATVKGFLEDYFCTSPAWTVKKSAQRVLAAVNAWLYSQTRQSQYRYDRERGYVCTMSAMVLKGTTAHVFHAGDSRVYRLKDGSLEQLTTDHRVWISQEESYLGRALGVTNDLEIDYLAVAMEEGDIFLLATDGVHEFASSQLIASAIRAHEDDLDAAARRIVREAYERGSEDNLTLQIVRIERLPEADAAGIQQQLTELPFPPELTPRMSLDGFRIVRELHSSSRSHVYLAVDEEDGSRVVLKTPSVDLRGDPAYLERFLMEEWIARRIWSPHVVKAFEPTRKRSYLYTVTEYVEGQTLRQWMIDNPRAPLEAVRGIVEQIAKGLLAFHRLEMLHQDLRPENVLIDATGTVKIVDFGSTRVAGIEESARDSQAHPLLGTAQYSAPEYFLGEPGTTRSDLFSLGVIAYEMLSGRLPYGADVAKCRTRSAQRKLSYRSVLDDDREIPAWIDEVLRKATAIDPNDRYEELSELVHDLRHPSEAWLNRTRPALLERNPLLFWKTLCVILVVIILVLLANR